MKFEGFGSVLGSRDCVIFLTNFPARDKSLEKHSKLLDDDSGLAGWLKRGEAHLKEVFLLGVTMA